jgi:hypothetical protein
VVSAGGNDALHYASMLEEKASSVAEALLKLADVRERFEQDYRAMLDDVVARGRPVAVCTVYDPRFPDAKQRRLASLGPTRPITNISATYLSAWSGSVTPRSI